MLEEITIVFWSTHDVMKAKNILGRASIPHQVVPTPKEISSECGMSLKVQRDVLDNVLQLFQARKVRYRDDLL